MLLIAEIILTIFAWRKGWRWYALLPLAIAFGIGFFMGIGIGASGGDISTVKGIGIIFDILAVIVLIVMCVKGPKSKELSETPKTE
jgi:hypothetical protein